MSVSESREHGIVSMLSAGLETPAQRRGWPWAALLLVLGWVGFMGISGVHLGGDWRGPLLGVSRLALFVGALSALAISVLVIRRVAPDSTALAALAAMVLAYVLGNGLSGLAHTALQPERLLAGYPTGVRFMASRGLYVAAVAAPMLVVWRLAVGPIGRLPLRFGDWSVKTRLGRTDVQRSWAFHFATLGLLGGSGFFLFMQWQVDFAPLTSGRLPALMLWIVPMALANAFAEELLFRGLLQGAATDAVGAPGAMWLVALAFGLHHWGASFAPLASFAGALGVGVGSVLFAKSVHETRGLGWAVAAHAVVNVGTFSAFYVAT